MIRIEYTPRGFQLWTSATLETTPDVPVRLVSRAAVAQALLAMAGDRRPGHSPTPARIKPCLAKHCAPAQPALLVPVATAERGSAERADVMIQSNDMMAAVQSGAADGPIAYTVDAETMDEGTVIYSLDGTHVTMAWCPRDAAVTFIFRAVDGDVDDHRFFELSPLVVRELAALTAHPQFAVCLAAIEAAGDPPTVAIQDAN